MSGPVDVLAPEHLARLREYARDTGAFRVDATGAANLAETCAATLEMVAAVAELVEAAQKVLSLHDYASTDGRGFNGDNLKEWNAIKLSDALARVKGGAAKPHKPEPLA